MSDITDAQIDAMVKRIESVVGVYALTPPAFLLAELAAMLLALKAERLAAFAAVPEE